MALGVVAAITSRVNDEFLALRRMERDVLHGAGSVLLGAASTCWVNSLQADVLGRAEFGRG